jgi:thiamine biosynthesis lipoprotein
MLRLAALTVLTICGLLAGCATAPPAPALQRHEFAEPHMGTLWRITLYAPDRASASNAAQAALARVAALDRMLTDYDPDSELMRLGKSPCGIPVPVSEDLFRVLEAGQKLSRASGGAFDVTSGPVVQLWRRARRQRQLPDPARLSAAQQAVGYTNLCLDSRRRTVTLLSDHVRLDVGGIAKGYAADEALRVLRRSGLPRALVAASGDLALGEPPPGKAGWRVAIGAPDPGDTNLIGVILLKNAGVSTSGDAEQSVLLDGVRYSHIIDPRSGRALTNRIQATVVANCVTRSDALATTVCVLGPEAGMKLIESSRHAAACIVRPGGVSGPMLLKSRGFPDLDTGQVLRTVSP